MPYHACANGAHTAEDSYSPLADILVSSYCLASYGPYRLMLEKLLQAVIQNTEWAADVVPWFARDIARHKEVKHRPKRAGVRNRLTVKNLGDSCPDG